MNLFGFSPSDSARALFTKINDRWNALAKWGVVEKLPNQGGAVADWKAYRDAWVDEREYYVQPGTTEPIEVVPALSAQANALNSVELDAKSKGYDAPPPVHALEAIDAEEYGRTADQIDAAAKAAEKAARDAASAPGALWSSIPWYWKAGGAAVLGLALVGAVRR